MVRGAAIRLYSATCPACEKNEIKPFDDRRFWHYFVAVDGDLLSRRVPLHVWTHSESVRMSGVAFVCQRCKQPLQVHESLTDISPAAFDLLAGSHISFLVPR